MNVRYKVFLKSGVKKLSFLSSILVVGYNIYMKSAAKS